MEENGNKPHKLEDLKSKLFSRNFKPTSPRPDQFSPVAHGNVSDSWPEEGGLTALNKFFMKTSIFKKLFILSLIFFALSLSYAAYIFFAGSNTVSGENIEISIIGNNFTAGGEEFSFVVSIANKNNASLDLVDLVVEYPKGSEEDNPRNTERLRESLGTIPAGSVRNENLKVVLFGEQGSVRPIKVSIEYRVAGSNAIFVKEKIYEVNINSTPLNLSVEGPDSISENQDLTLNIKTSQNATRAAEDILVKVDYPLGFRFIKSVPAPSFGNNVWFLGDLAPGAEHGISISGQLQDVFDGEEKTFNIWSGSQSRVDKGEVDVVFNSAKHTVTVEKPFIAASVAVNGVVGREFAVNAKTPVNVEVRYANNLNTKVNDLTIEAKVSGNALDRTSIRATQGYYDSAKNLITWSKSGSSRLSEVDPGDSDSVGFSFESLPILSSSGGVLSDPSINIEVNIYSRQEVEDASLGELKNTASATVKVISDLGFSAKALHYSGGFTNTGPIPPKAEETTTYTIVWSVINSGNTISRAQLASTLPTWVQFVGPVAPASEDVSFNSSSRTIIWDIGKITKGTGVSTAAKTASFQISLKPSLSQVGSAPLLLNESILTGHDDFANVDVRVHKGGLDTWLTSDPNFPSNGGVVVE